MTYNLQGKRITSENLAGQVTTTAWDCCHKVSETQPDGSTTISLVDNRAWRQVRAEDAAGVKTIKCAATTISVETCVNNLAYIAGKKAPREVPWDTFWGGKTPSKEDVAPLVK